MTLTDAGAAAEAIRSIIRLFLTLCMLALIGFLVWFVMRTSLRVVGGHRSGNVLHDVMESFSESPKWRRRRVERRFLQIRRADYVPAERLLDEPILPPRVKVEKTPTDPTGGVKP